MICMFVSFDDLMNFGIFIKDDSCMECLGGMYMFAICNCCDVER